MTKRKQPSDSGTQSSPLEVIKPQIDFAVELVEGTPDEGLWPELLSTVWIEAVSALIRLALQQQGRRDAAEIQARRFGRAPPPDQHIMATRYGLPMDQFVRIVRTARGFHRSSQRPPPFSTAPARRRDSGVELVGIVLDPRLRKINPR